MLVLIVTMLESMLDRSVCITVMSPSMELMLDSISVTPLTESFSAFLSTVLVSFRPGQVLSVTGPGGLTLLRNEDERWSWRRADGEPVSGTAVVVLLNRLLRLSTERVEALLPRQDQLRDWQLAPAARSFALTACGR